MEVLFGQNRHNAGGSEAGRFGLFQILPVMLSELLSEFFLTPQNAILSPDNSSVPFRTAAVILTFARPVISPTLLRIFHHPFSIV
jgi:hypothetical protein